MLLEMFYCRAQRVTVAAMFESVLGHRVAHKVLETADVFKSAQIKN